MSYTEQARIDKFLWATRIFKTRGDATEACKSGKVMVNQVKAKPSRVVFGHETIEVRNHGVWRKYLALKIVEKRVGAKKVHELIMETTPQEELEKLKNILASKQESKFIGLGRPTKKQRRDIDNWKDEI